MIKQFELRALRDGMPNESEEVLGLLEDGKKLQWALVYYQDNRWFYVSPREGFPDHGGGRTNSYESLDFSIPMGKRVAAWAPMPPARFDE